MTMTSRAKAAVRIIRSSRIGRLAADEVLIALSGPLGTNPSSSDLLCRFSIYDMAHGAERLGTVSALATLFFELVECLDIERFIEAGAKDGAASIRAAALPSIAEVVAFEANPYTHERFHEQLRQHGVRHEHMALSDREGAVEFLVRLNSDGRPIANRPASLLERFDCAPGPHRGRRRCCHARRLLRSALRNAHGDLDGCRGGDFDGRSRWVEGARRNPGCDHRGRRARELGGPGVVAGRCGPGDATARTDTGRP